MTKKTKINILYVLASIFFVMLFFIPLGCDGNDPDDGSSEPVFSESSIEIIERELLLIGAIPANNSTDVLWETTEFELEFSEPLLISSGTAISFSDSGVSKLIPIQRVIDSGAFALSDDKKIVTLDVTQLEDHYKVLLADPDARDGDDEPVFRLKAEATFTFTFKGLGIADISETEKAIVSAEGYTYSFTVGEAEDLNPEVVAEKSSITDNVTLTLVDGIEATLTDEGSGNYCIVSSDFPVGVNVSIGVTHPANIIGLLAMEWGGVNFSFSETINTSNHIYTSDAPIDIDAGNNDFSANVFELFFKGDSVKTKSKQLAVTGVVVDYTIGDIELVTTTRSGNEVISREEIVDANKYQVAEWTVSNLQPYYTVSSWSYPLSVGMRVKVLLPPDAVANQVSVRFGPYNFSYSGPVSGESGAFLYTNTSSTPLVLSRAAGEYNPSNQFQIYSGANREDQKRISDANRQLNIYAYDTIFNDNIFTTAEATGVNNNARYTLLNNKIEKYNSDGVDQGAWQIEKQNNNNLTDYDGTLVLDNGGIWGGNDGGNHAKSFTTKRLYTNLVYEMEWQFSDYTYRPVAGNVQLGKAAGWMGWPTDTAIDGANFGLFVKAHPRTGAAKPGEIQRSTVEIQLCLDKTSIKSGTDWDTIRFKGQLGINYAWNPASPANGRRCYRPGSLYDLYPWKFDNAQAPNKNYDSITKPNTDYLVENGAWHKITVIVNKDRLRVYFFNGNAVANYPYARLMHDVSTVSDDFKNRVNNSIYAGKLAEYIGYESFVDTGALRGGRMAIQPGNGQGWMYIRNVRLREL